MCCPTFGVRYWFPRAPGYADFLAAITDPNHQEQNNYLAWHGGPFDPTAFNLNEINEVLAQIKI